MGEGERIEGPIDDPFTERVAQVTGVEPDHIGLDPHHTSVGLASPAIQVAPVAIYTVDLLGKIRSWNPAAEELFGWSAEEIIGQTVPFLSDDDMEEAFGVLARLLRDEPISGATYTPVRRDGEELHVLTSAALLRDADGEPNSIITFAVDITAREAANRMLTEASYRWRKLLENISDTITVVDADGKVIETTGQFGDVLGYEPDWWEGAAALDLIHPDERAHAEDLLVQVLENPGQEFRHVYRTRHQDGHYELIEFTVVNLLDDPAIGGIVISSGNVTEVRKAEMLVEQEAHLLGLIARDAPLSDVLSEIVEMVEHHSDGCTGLFLLDPSGSRLRSGASGTMPRALVRGVEAVPLDARSGIGATIERREPVVIEDFATSTYTQRDAPSLAALGFRSGWSVPIIAAGTSEILGVIATAYGEARRPSTHELDVGSTAADLASIAIERSRSRQELYHQARHHQLTGLPNRQAIKDHVEAALERSRSAGGHVAAMFIDIDRFKVVNDSFGHTSGDKLLVRFAGRLRNLVRPGDFVGHFAADEFVVVLERVAGIDDVRFVGDRVTAALEEPFALDEGEVYLSASMGVALSEPALTTGETLLHQADAAMFEAKRRGGDRLAVFDDEMQARAVEHLRVDRDLRLALEQNGLELHYQPEIDLSTGRIAGAEALLRWQHADRGLVLPHDFIGIAESTGVIVNIGRFVLDEAVRQAHRWREDHDRGDLFVSVNLSARQLTWRELVPTVAGVLEAHDWPADQLFLEITESVLIDDAEAALVVLGQLKDLGVQLAIDDFGTGYSSLSYLHRFPVDMVKIDQSFVQPLDTEEGSPVAAAVMHMAAALGLRTCAEGVEGPRQLEVLRDLGCDLAQGFLIAKALDLPSFATMLDADPRW